MLDITYIRENTESVKQSVKDRGANVNIDELLKLDDKRRDLQTGVDELRRQRNEVATRNKGGKPTEEDIKAGKAIKEELTALEGQLNEADKLYKEQLLAVPNMAGPDVPVGKDDTENVVVRTWGEKPDFAFEARDHMEIGELLDLIDTDTAAKTSGSRFFYLKNEAVLLEFALVQWLLQKFVQKGFTPVTTPQLVKEHMMIATGFFPADRNEIYRVNPDEDDLYLVGTSEVPLAGLHMFNPLNVGDLPRRYVGFSTCFRREAGTYGKDTRGILRMHQFDKLEMYSYVHPDKSWEEHEYLLGIEEEILQELGLPYQVVNICTGDLGAPAAKKYDLEAWIPTQGKYRELTSCSNTTDYQARRGGIKYRDEKGKLHFCHTLNGTAMSTNRPIIAILENYQQADGSVIVPEVLRPFVGKEVIRPKK